MNNIFKLWIFLCLGIVLYLPIFSINNYKIIPTKPELKQVLSRTPKLCQEQRGLASWYGKGKCLDGTTFTGRRYTVASRSLPRGTRIRISWENKICYATVTDYGPEKRTGKILDCSERIAKEMGWKKRWEIIILKD